MRTTVPTSGALHFSTRSEYGVRLMVELARHVGSGPVSLTEMAEHEELPRPYLEQLVSSLREAGLVTSTRGARGGYELARDPAHIHMNDVVTALEGPIAPMLCASTDGHAHDRCARVGTCTVERLWRRVRDAVVEALGSMTLAELVDPGSSHPVHLAQPGDTVPPATDGTDPPARDGRAAQHDTVLVTVRPRPQRPAKEPVPQP